MPPRCATYFVDRPSAPLPPGHPADTFRQENAALAAQVSKLRAALAALAAGPPVDAPLPEAVDAAKRLYGELMDIEKHYQRKEHLLFSCLERHGITGPSKVMWGKDDEARGLLKALGVAMGRLRRERGAMAAALAQTAAEPALAAVEEMVFKEERILLPMALQNLSEGEWGEIWSQSPQFGFCLVEPGRATRRRRPQATCRMRHAPRRHAPASRSPRARARRCCAWPISLRGRLSLSRRSAPGRSCCRRDRCRSST